VEFFQLKSIDLPDPYELEIQNTEIKRQDIHKAEAERLQMVIGLETKILQAEISSYVNINRAEGNASVWLQSNLANSEGFYKMQVQQATSLADVKTSLNLSTLDLVKYLRAKVLKEHDENKMIIGLN